MAKVKMKKSGSKKGKVGGVLGKYKRQAKKSSRSFKKDINWIFQGTLQKGQTAVSLIVEDFHPYFVHRVKVEGADKELTCSGNYDVVMKNGHDPDNCRICRVSHALELSALAPKAKYAWFAWFPDVKEMDSEANPKVPCIFITGGMIYNAIFARFIEPRILEEEGVKERIKKHPPLDEMQIIITKSGSGMDTEYDVEAGDLEKKKGKLVCDVEIPKAVLKNATEEVLNFERYVSPKDDEYLDGVLKDYEDKIPDDYSSGIDMTGDEDEEDGGFDVDEFVKSGEDVADLSGSEVRELASHFKIKAKGPKSRRRKVASRIEKERDK